MKLLASSALTLILFFTSSIVFAQFEDCECELEIDLVCAENSDGFNMVFPNACFAECADFAVIEEGCEEYYDYLDCECELELDPVCISDSLGNIYPFPSACFAECFELEIVLDEDCDLDIFELPDSLGCTLTQGYWKNHSEFGPAPYDSTWSELPDGASTAFFESGYTYYEIMHESNSGGNAYFKLAKQWIAAELNVIAGASIPEVEAEAWLDGLQILSENDSTALIVNGDEDHDEANEIAGILDDYNNGETGPGHCGDLDDEDTSIPWNNSTNNSDLFNISEVYPNPVLDHLNISIDSKTNAVVWVNVYALTGGIISNTPYSLSSGMQNITITLKDYEAGMYCVQFMTLNQIIGTRRIVKN